jgi:hypothetical protein
MNRDIGIQKYEILVFGATPCGIAAALGAARYGRRVVLITGGKRVGGLMANGLSITDLRFPEAFGGIFREFTDRILSYYTTKYGKDSQQARDCNRGLWFEPHVAEEVFETMLAAEQRIAIWRNQELQSVSKDQERITSVGTVDCDNGCINHFLIQVAVDASYEGDLAAMAGVPCRIGREAREEYGEPYAGFIFLKNPGLELLPGSHGAGDRRIQAYNFRLCLSNRPEIRVLPQKPADYRREEYLPLLELCRQEAIRSIEDVIRLAPITNGKYNGNNRPVIRSLDLPEENSDYPTADRSGREKIIRRYRDYTLGLLWFLQNDPDLPESFKTKSREWGLCNDEFVENNGLPYELYIREARRIVGRKTFTSHNAFLEPGKERTPVREDSIGVADYHVDSHIVQRKRPGWPQIEGHVYLRPLSKPAQIPYGIMLPQTVEGLLVPGAVSATHLGFSVLRMEPPWMVMGQAAGTAAHLALQMNVTPDQIPVSALQRMLIEAGQVLTFFHDVPGPDPVWLGLSTPGERTRPDYRYDDISLRCESPGVQFFGTKGFFNTYYARPKEPLTRSEAVLWLNKFILLEGPGITRYDDGTFYQDIDAKHPDYEVTRTLTKMGIIEGWAGSDLFCSGAAVSRADAVKWVGKAVMSSKGWVLPQQRENGWPDCEPDDVAFDYYELFKQWELLPRTWMGRDEIKPRVYITREEFCDLLYNVYFSGRADKHNEGNE